MFKFRWLRAEKANPQVKAPENLVSLEDEVMSLKGHKEILKYAIDNDYRPNETQMSRESGVIIFTNRNKPSIAYDLRKDNARVLIADAENMSTKRAMFLFLDKANAYGYYPKYGYASLAPYFMQYAYGAMTGKSMLTDEFIVFGTTTCPKSIVKMTHSYYNNKGDAKRYAEDNLITMEASIISGDKDYFQAADAVRDAILYAIFMIRTLELTTKRYEVNSAVNHGYTDRVPSYHFTTQSEETKYDVSYIIDKMKSELEIN